MRASEDKTNGGKNTMEIQSIGLVQVLEGEKANICTNLLLWNNYCDRKVKSRHLFFFPCFCQNRGKRNGRKGSETNHSF